RGGDRRRRTEPITERTRRGGILSRCGGVPPGGRAGRHPALRGLLRSAGVPPVGLGGAALVRKLAQQLEGLVELSADVGLVADDALQRRRLQQTAVVLPCLSLLNSLFLEETDPLRLVGDD